MCGISGFVNIQVNDDFLDITDHRGPDDRGVFRHKNLVLGHNRLSIQDLSENGHQPFVSKDEKFALVFNGEIYNHWDIREELLAKGYEFISKSDTETLLYAYIEFGEEIFKKLNGIFAFALFDIERNELLVVRDHFGIKPLYYYQAGNKFAFGSEMKVFQPYIDNGVTKENFSNYLNFLWSPGEKTPYSKVKKLLPGHFMKIRLDEVKCEPIQYYDIPFEGKYSEASEEELIDELDELLQAVVKRQMLADTPVGFFLSGGLDSSLLVAIAKKSYPDKKLQTFTIKTEAEGGNDGFVDDLFYAKKVAQFLDVNLEIVNAEVNILNDFDKMIWHLEEPQADPAPLNVLNICKRAREMGYKVLIGGAGGDELFSGYRRHQALSYEKYFGMFPMVLKKALKAGFMRIPNGNATIRRAKKILSDIDKTKEERIVGYYSWLPFDQLCDLFIDEIAKSVRANKPTTYLLELLHSIPEEKDWLNRMLYFELKSFLVDHNLNYTDKMSMAVGVEARVPFLDIELVEFSTKMPTRLKMKGNETKYILKKVAERYLPNEIIYRPKTGFGAPVRKWIKNDLDGLINERLSDDQINSRNIFKAQSIRDMISDNKADRIDASYPIWSLLAIESWMRQFADKK